MERRKIKDEDISIRLIYFLKSIDINYVDEINSIDEVEILKRIGKRSYIELIEYMKKNKLNFK